MLNRLKLENFKAWREADLTFGRVTGLFGTNSAGKSSLLHLLLLLKQTRNATDRSIVLDFGGPADMVNLGTFEDIVHQHDKTKAISWHLDWALPRTLTIEDPRQPSADPLLHGSGLQIRYAVGLHHVEHMIVLALEGQGWDLTWPWASWDLQHRDGARIEVKQSADRQTWHKRPKPPFPLPSRGKFGINRPSESYYLEDGTYEKTRRPQRHADIYVFAWHPVEDLNEADHRRPDQWEFFVVPEKCLPRPKDDSKTDSITPGQLVKCDRAVHCAYKKLADNVTKVRESLGSLKAEAVVT